MRPRATLERQGSGTLERSGSKNQIAGDSDSEMEDFWKDFDSSLTDAGEADGQNFCARVASAAASLLVWFASSIALVLHNKWLFLEGDSYGNFPYPISLMVLHQIATALVFVIGLASMDGDTLKQSAPTFGKRRHLDATRLVFPIAVGAALSLIFGNVGMVFFSVHVLTMAKAAKPVMVAVAQVALSLATFSCVQFKILICIFVLTAGAVGAENVEMTPESLGVLFLMLICDAVRVVLIQKNLQGENKLDSATLLLYVSIQTAAFVFPVATVCEGSDVFAAAAGVGAGQLGLNSVLGIAVNLSFLQAIERTDALTIELAGIARDFLLIFASSWAFEAEVSGRQIACYGVSLVFLHVYVEYKANSDLFERMGVVRATLERSRAACKRRRSLSDAEEQLEEDEDLLRRSPKSNLGLSRGRDEVFNAEANGSDREHLYEPVGRSSGLAPLRKI